MTSNRGKTVIRGTLQGLRVLGLLVAATLAVATSAGETNDEEDLPGGSDPGGEQTVGDDEVDFSEVEVPTEVVVGGDNFLLTNDGAYILTLRTTWFGGGDQTPELRSRQLVAISTETGQRTTGLDLRQSGDFGIVLLDNAQQLVLVHRSVDGSIKELQGVSLPGFATLWTHQPATDANVVRMSPSGRFAALWQENRLDWGNGSSWKLDVENLTVSVRDLQGNAEVTFTGVKALADVLAEPDSSAFYVAISKRNYDQIELSSLKLIRVSLTSNLPTTQRILSSAGHATDLEMKGGSSLRLNPDSGTLVFAGCTFDPGTCNARLFVVDADTLQARGDLRGAGAAAFDPTSDLALGWDGASNDEGKIWITDCQAANMDETDPYYVDHWLMTFDTDTLDTSVIELPWLAPYYFITRDGEYAVVSTQNCGDEQLYAVSLDTGSATAIQYGDHALHEFTVLDDHRTIYSVDRGLLERIDLDTQSATPSTLTHYVTRINRLPDSSKLVLASPDMMTFYLYDVSQQAVTQTFGINAPPSPAPPAPNAWSPTPSIDAPAPRVRVHRLARRAPQLTRPRLPGNAIGEEQSL
ncbi:MAG: hypothetical protein ABI333_14750 [bacterium]